MNNTAIVIRNDLSKKWFVRVTEDNGSVDLYPNGGIIFDDKIKITEAEAMDIMDETFAWNNYDPYYYKLGMRKNRGNEDIKWSKNFEDCDYIVELFDNDGIFEDCAFHTLVMAKEWARGRGNANYTAKITQKAKINWFNCNYNESLKKMVR